VTSFSFDSLRRFPDVEAANLYAVDASDRLILDEAADVLASARPGGVVVIGDHYGALTLGAAAGHGLAGIRTHQDSLTGERALALNAAAAGLQDAYGSHELDAALVEGAAVVLLQLPRSLAELEEIAELVAANADPDVTVFAGGRIKHLSLAMNEVLAAQFGEVRASLARQKSRVLVACRPTPSAVVPFPRREHHDDLGLWVVAHGSAFAGTKIDIGTRFLLSFLDRMAPTAQTAIDLGCGTGILAAAIATKRAGMRVIATDQSAGAVASARETMLANGLSDRVTVVRDDGLASQPDASADLVLCNPPFHVGAAVHSDVALKLFADAARVLRPGGQLWTVFNSPLAHGPALRRIVGRTEIVGSNRKFTVACSVR
jgi:16S rRNA (guanine1207-N2)-methyltransferase